MNAATEARRSEDLRLPLWLRLTALAVEWAQPDEFGVLVAEFGPGEVREILAADLGAGQVGPSSVTRAIRLAERHGLLARGSSVRCLRVLPGSLTTGVSS